VMVGEWFIKTEITLMMLVVMIKRTNL
jgi:hypothetical protein